MRIVHVCRLYAPHIGGVETHVAAVAHVQARQGHQVTIVTTQHDSSLPLEEVGLDGIQIIRLPLDSSEQKLKTWWWMHQHSVLFRNANFLHVHDIFWWIFFLFLIYRVNFLITFHGWETVWPVPFSHKLHRWIAARCARIKVHVGSWIQKIYWDVPDAVLYGGVDRELFKLPKPKLGRTVHIIFLGRLEHDTGVLQYLELLAELKRQRLGYTMLWVGDGSLRGRCEQVGTVTGLTRKVVQHLRVSDIVFASTYLSMLQAQAASRLVVSMYSNDLKKKYLEAYPGSQYCIITDKPDTGATQLLSLLSKPERLQYIQNEARQFARTQTWESVTAIYQNLWQQFV